MKNIVISQSMYFPWVGLLEEIRLADIFVHYDDVQFARGFLNRVQVKTAQGIRWITVPLKEHHRDVLIDEALINDDTDWRSQHREILRQAYFKAPFRDDMLALVDRVFNKPALTLADISRSSLMELAAYFGLVEGKVFEDSRVMGIGSSSTQRLLNIMTALKGDVYITGHGAKNYLDHSLFEKNGISVQYMKYRCLPYPQLHGEFTPYVTGLDLVANCGKDGASVIQSTTVDWKEFILEQQ